MKTAFLSLFLLIGCHSYKLAAQMPTKRFEKVNLPNPLSSVEGMFEDSRGFLWIGTYIGLYRYDGYELRHFQHSPGNSKSIGDNKITKILEDPKGNLWVGTQAGLNYFDQPGRQFKRFSDTAVCGLGQVFIRDLAFDSNGTLWVASWDGLYYLDQSKEQFSKRLTENSSRTKSISEVEPALRGIYYTQNDQLYYLNDEIHQRIDVQSIATNFTTLATDSTSTDQSPEGILWVGTTNGLFCIDRLSQEVSEIEALRGLSIGLITGQGGNWLVFTSQGLFFVDSRTRQARGPVNLLLDGEDKPVSRITLSASNGITWLITNKGVLYKSDTLKERFNRASITLPNSGPGALCELFEYNPGVLLIPGEKGASLFDIHSAQVSPFPYTPDYNLDEWKMGMTCFLEEDSMLWIGTVGGLFLLDRKIGRFVPLEQKFKALKQLRKIPARKICRDRKGNLWVASWNMGIFRISPDMQFVKQYLFSPEHKAAFLHHGRFAFETREGDLWFGTRGGLLKYLEKADSFLIYRNIPNDSTSMSENTSFCIYEDAEGNIWSGSYGGGLNCLDVKTGKFRHYTTDDGLHNNSVFCLLPDRKNNLWMSGFDGLSVFNLSTKSFRTFTSNQGLLNSGFAAFVYGKSRFSDTLFFGGAEGADFFNPDDISPSKHIPKVYFTDFKLFNESVAISDEENTTDGRFTLPQDISYTKQITLRYDQNVLTFDYTALDYSSPQTIQYAYQLVGFDTAWQYAGDKRSVTFTNLNPGAYTLKVKASNGDGIWDIAESNVKAIEIIVTPPWWRTWTFRIALLLFISLLVIAIYNYRVKQIRYQSELNQRIAQVKMEALRSQMNPHFVFNCLSSLKLFVEKNETEKASDHISKFATLLRRVLDDARTDTETVTLERELDTLRRYVELEMIRFKEKFDFRMDIDPNLDLQNIEIPPLILQPYVENAILHGLQHKTDGKGLLQVKVTEAEGNVNIVVEDNGVGREAAKAIKARNPGMQQSHGLNVTAERLDYFSQKYGTSTAIETTDLFTPEGTPAGTRVTLSFQTESSV